MKTDLNKDAPGSPQPPRLDEAAERFAAPRVAESNPLSLCGRKQHKMASGIAALLLSVSDASPTGEGTTFLVELIRRLVELRGFRKVASTESVVALGRLASFQHMLHQVLERDPFLSAQESMALFDSIVQHLLKTSHLLYVDPGSPILSSDSVIVNRLLHKCSGFTPAAGHKVYPAIRISLRECLAATTAVTVPHQLQLVISRFLERVFCRIPGIFLDHFRRERSDACVPRSIVSRLVCVLDFSDLPLSSAVSGDARQSIRAVTDTIWAFAPVLLHAVVFHGLHRAHELLWNWIGLAEPGTEQYLLSGVRVLITDAQEDLDRLLRPSTREKCGWNHTLGGHEDSNTLRHACDFDRLLCHHLQPSALMLDDFWASLPDLRKLKDFIQERKQDARTELAVPPPPYVCLKGPRSTRKSKQPLSSVACTLDHIPCSGPLLETVDGVHTTLCERFKPAENGTDIDRYIRNAAAEDVLGIRLEDLSFPNPALLPDVTERCPPSIYTTANVYRDPAKLCVWKGLGYYELCKPLPFPL